MKTQEQVPVGLVLAHHGGTAEKYPAVDFFKQSVIDSRESSPDGSVMVLMEFVNHTNEESQTITDEVKSGVLPSIAILRAVKRYNLTRLSHDAFQKASKAEFSNPFHTGYRKSLDEVFMKYGQRFVLVPEAAPESEISASRPYIKGYYNAFKKLVEHGEMVEAEALMRRMIEFAGHSSAIREERIAKTLPETLAKEAGVIAVWSYFGEAHTGLSRELRQAGFQVKRYFPDGKPSFDNSYLTYLGRQLRFFPNRLISEEIWQTAFETMVNNIQQAKESTE